MRSPLSVVVFAPASSAALREAARTERSASAPTAVRAGRGTTTLAELSMPRTYARQRGLPSTHTPAEPRNSAILSGRHARAAARICPFPRTHVTYYLFAPQGSGEAESLTPLKWRTTPHLKLS